MGHYYSEMMCNACGGIRCKCLSKPVFTTNLFVVNESYDVMTEKEYEQTINPAVRTFARLMIKKFETREEAELEAIECLKVAIEKLKIQTNTLTQKLKDKDAKHS